MTTDPHQIARSLSPIARKTILALSGDYKRSSEMKVSEAVCMDFAFDGLAQTGFDKTGWYYTFALNSSGLAVRAIIERDSNGK